ncbi:MAG TPA: TonB C-terminal domain-containing protein [Rhodoblastus sp.]|nr:TonB C-terminal domain-containing protein [Rhodoblastus sp.]
MAAATRRFAWIVLCCVLAHVIVFLLFERLYLPDSPTPMDQEIPVEVIAEPPTPKEPDPAPSDKEQPAKQATLDEKEATEAPRASEQKVDKDVRSDGPPAAKANPQPAPAEPQEAPDRKAPSKAAEDSARQAKDDRMEGEPLKGAERPRPDKPEQTKSKETAPEPAKPQMEAMAPTLDPAPEDPFAAALRYSPVGGGDAKATYLSIVYGLVAPHLDLKKIAAGRAFKPGEIVFAIDFGGALVGAKVIKTSGLRDVDAAAIAALRAAAPFPLPPTGTGITLSFRFAGS